MFLIVNESSGQPRVRGTLSQDISSTGVQWEVDFSKGFKVVFNETKFQVGRESGDMTMSDLDGDGLFEISAPITSFYGLEHGRFPTMDTPLPTIIFKYDPASREYLPANAKFKEGLLQEIETAETNLLTTNEARLGQLLCVVLDYVFIGEERRGWELFERTCTLPEKSRIKRDVQRSLNRHPVYNYLQSTSSRRHSAAR